MRTIWKFPLAFQREQEIEVPAGALPLSVGTQPINAGEGIMLWAEVVDDPDHPKETLVVTIIGTGHPLSDDAGQFIGTTLTYGGKFVWHVYVKTPRWAVGDPDGAE